MRRVRRQRRRSRRTVGLRAVHLGIELTHERRPIRLVDRLLRSVHRGLELRRRPLQPRQLHPSRREPLGRRDGVAHSEVDRTDHINLPLVVEDPALGKHDRLTGDLRLLTLPRLAEDLPAPTGAERRTTVLAPAHLLPHQRVRREVQVGNHLVHLVGQVEVLVAHRVGQAVLLEHRSDPHGAVRRPRLHIDTVVPEDRHDLKHIGLLQTEVAGDELQHVTFRPLTRVPQLQQRFGEIGCRQLLPVVTGKTLAVDAQRNPERLVRVRQPHECLGLLELQFLVKGPVREVAHRRTSGEFQPLTPPPNRLWSDVDRLGARLQPRVQMCLPVVTDQPLDREVPVPSEQQFLLAGVVRGDPLHPDRRGALRHPDVHRHFPHAVVGYGRDSSGRGSELVRLERLPQNRRQVPVRDNPLGLYSAYDDHVLRRPEALHRPVHRIDRAQRPQHHDRREPRPPGECVHSREGGPLIVRLGTANAAVDHSALARAMELQHPPEIIGAELRTSLREVPENQVDLFVRRGRGGRIEAQLARVVVQRLSLVEGELVHPVVPGLAGVPVGLRAPGERHGSGDGGNAVPRPTRCGQLVVGESDPHWQGQLLERLTVHPNEHRRPAPVHDQPRGVAALVRGAVENQREARFRGIAEHRLLGVLVITQDRVTGHRVVSEECGARLRIVGQHCPVLGHRLDAHPLRPCGVQHDQLARVRIESVDRRTRLPIEPVDRRTRPLVQPVDRRTCLPIEAEDQRARPLIDPVDVQACRLVEPADRVGRPPVVPEDRPTRPVEPEDRRT